MIPFGQFEPARSQFNTNATNVATNVRPVADGWGPIKNLEPYSNTLGEQALGGVFVRTDTGEVFIFIGTADALYKFNSGTLDFDDVSRASPAYTGVPDGDAWCFTVFGNTLVATNYNDEPQAFDINSGTLFADLAGSPPKAKYCWVAGDFLTLGYLDGLPSQIAWSGLNDAEWWTYGERGSDFQQFPDGGEVQGGITEVGGAIVFQRNAIRFQQFTGSTYIFSFQVLNATRGTVAPRSVVSVGPQQYAYLAESGFFMGPGTAIGAQTIDEWFLGGTELDLDKIDLVQGVADPYEKIIWWRYQNINGDYRLLGYNWQLGRWCWSTLAANFLISVLTPGVTWDGLDALYANIDAVDVPFDSRLFRGGRPNFAGFDSDNKLGYFTGDNLEATVETAIVQQAPGRRSFVNGFRVMTDAPTLTGAVARGDFYGDPLTWDAAASRNTTGLVPARADGRQHRFRVTIPAGTVWDILHGVEPQVQATGQQ
ncbi:hypothetical protein [Roseibium sp.]|uniref:hypothetical protein n=1 Tax=Roseibium sp. TaxID=1936156 RepID=UPI003274F04D